MSNLADTFPASTVTSAAGYPAHVGPTPPINPYVGWIWFNPVTGVTSYYTASGWVSGTVDMSAYVPLAGTALMTGGIAWKGVANVNVGVTVIDGKGGTIDNSVVDAGRY